MLKVKRQRGSQINHSSLIYAADQPHGATTVNGKGTEGLAVIWDWHLVLESHSFFCSSLFAHFHPSIPSLFNWLFVKVLLSASTCPCHSKQRQPGDTAVSLFSPVSALFFPLPSSLTFFCLLLISSLVLSTPLIPWHFSLSPYHSFFLSRSDLYFFVSVSFCFTYFLSCFFFFYLALWPTHIVTVFWCISLSHISLSLFEVKSIKYFCHSVVICDLWMNMQWVYMHIQVNNIAYFHSLWCLFLLLSPDFYILSLFTTYWASADCECLHYANHFLPAQTSRDQSMSIPIPSANQCQSPFPHPINVIPSPTKPGLIERHCSSGPAC